MKKKSLKKSLKLPKDSIYIVVDSIPYEGYLVIATFKTKQLAQKFIDECKRILKDGKTELQFGKHVIDKYDVDNIELLDYSLATDAAEVPFFQ